jgi:hypothetical protein
LLNKDPYSTRLGRISPMNYRIKIELMVGLKAHLILNRRDNLTDYNLEQPTIIGRMFMNQVGVNV